MFLRSPLLRRPSAATVLATIALFVALGGTSYAAITITGAHIKNGSVTSVDVADGKLGLQGSDVKDGSLLFGDLAPSTRAALKGEPGDTGERGDAGATGAAGPAGAAGTTGARGPSSGYVYVDVDVAANPAALPAHTAAADWNPTGAGTFRSDMTPLLPAGAYQVVARVDYQAVGADSIIRCATRALDSSPDEVARLQRSANSTTIGAAEGIVSFPGAATLNEPGMIQIKCWEFENGATSGAISVSRIELHLTRVETLTSGALSSS